MAGAFTVVSDLDGTLLPAPHGTAGSKTGAEHPPLSAGPAHAPLLALLDAGATVVGVTGSRFETHCERFFHELPLSARASGQVLFAVESGTVLFRGDADGSPVEDREFARRTFGEGGRPMFSTEQVAALVELGKAGMRRFFEDVRADSGLLEQAAADEHVVHAVRAVLARLSGELDVPVSADGNVFPRIEVRAAGSAVVFVGIPSSLSSRYFSMEPTLAALVDGRPTGRLCFDCVPPGVGKHAVIRYLLQTGEISPGRAIALGDRPCGNDEGLTRWHKTGEIPFVSVAENTSLVPDELRACHAGGNDVGAAAVLRALLAWLPDGGRTIFEPRAQASPEARAPDSEDDGIDPPTAQVAQAEKLVRPSLSVQRAALLVATAKPAI